MILLPYHQCMGYLPTFSWSLTMVHVGKYTSPMDPMATGIFSWSLSFHHLSSWPKDIQAVGNLRSWLRHSERRIRVTGRYFFCLKAKNGVERNGAEREHNEASKNKTIETKPSTNQHYIVSNRIPKCHLQYPSIIIWSKVLCGSWWWSSFCAGSLHFLATPLMSASPNKIRNKMHFNMNFEQLRQMYQQLENASSFVMFWYIVANDS